jgi:N-acetyltransferase
MEIKPVILQGQWVRLQPLDLAQHWQGLLTIGLDPDLWRWTAAQVRCEADLLCYLQRALAEKERGVSLPFAIVLQESGQVVGCTRFCSIVPEHQRAEIGFTWVARAHQRSVVNTQAKYLLLQHAFEVWGLRRVELKTSATNLRSQAAMRRLGFVCEGTFRKWMSNDDGTARDTMWFSVIDDEWPSIKVHLETLLLR